MDKVIIFGVNMFSAVVFRTIVQEHLAEVLCFTLNKQYIDEVSFEGLPVVPFETLSERYEMDKVKIAITLGYSNMNKNREIVYNQCKEKGYDIYTLISVNANVYSEDVGEGSILLPSSFVGPYVRIGKCVILWNQVCVPHHSSVGDFTHIAGGTTVGGGSNIGKYCFIGMNCSIKNGIDIGDKTFIGANSYMSQSTKGGLGYWGNPAENIKNITSDIMIQFID